MKAKPFIIVALVVLVFVAGAWGLSRGILKIPGKQYMQEYSYTLPRHTGELPVMLESMFGKGGKYEKATLKTLNVKGNFGIGTKNGEAFDVVMFPFEVTYTQNTFALLVPPVFVGRNYILENNTLVIQAVVYGENTTETHVFDLDKEHENYVVDNLVVWVNPYEGAKNILAKEFKGAVITSVVSAGESTLASAEALPEGLVCSGNGEYGLGEYQEVLRRDSVLAMGLNYFKIIGYTPTHFYATYTIDVLNSKNIATIVIKARGEVGFTFSTPVTVLNITNSEILYVYEYTETVEYSP